MEPGELQADDKQRRARLLRRTLQQAGALQHHLARQHLTSSSTACAGLVADMLHAPRSPIRSGSQQAATAPATATLLGTAQLNHTREHHERLGALQHQRWQHQQEAVRLRHASEGAARRAAAHRRTHRPPPSTAVTVRQSVAGELFADSTDIPDLLGASARTLGARLISRSKRNTMLPQYDMPESLHAPHLRHRDDFFATWNAHKVRDEAALSTLRLRQKLLEQHLLRSERQRRPPEGAAEAYAEALAPVVSFCRQLVLDMADAVVARFIFRPSPNDAAKEKLAWRQRRPELLSGVAHALLDHMLQAVIWDVAAAALQDARAAHALPQRFANDLIVAAVATTSREPLRGGATVASSEHLRSSDDAATESTSEAPGLRRDRSIHTTPPRVVLRRLSRLRTFAIAEVDSIEGLHTAAPDAPPRSAEAVYREALDALLRHMQAARHGGAGSLHVRAQPLQAFFPEGASLGKQERARISGLPPPLSGAARCPRASASHRTIAALASDGTSELLAAASAERSYWGLVEVHLRSQTKPLAAADGTATDMAVHPGGCFVALSTGKGSVHIFDTRSGALREIYTHRGGEGELETPASQKQLRWGRKAAQTAAPSSTRTGPEPALLQAEICGVAFGSVGHFAVTYSDGTVAVLAMRPHASSPSGISEPLRPCPIAVLSPQQCVASGKIELSDSLTFVATSTAQHTSIHAPPPSADLTRLTVPRRPAFHPAFTISGAQPYVLCPQPTGDLLRLCTPCAGPLVFGGAPRTAPQAVSCSAEAQAFMLPAPERSAAVPPTAQRLYRGHSQHVVYAGALANGSGLVTVDMAGVAAVWPSGDGGSAAGLGWLQPEGTARLPSMALVPQLSGMPRRSALPVGPGGDAAEDASGALPSGHRRWIVMYLRNAKGVLQRQACYLPPAAHTAAPADASKRPFAYIATYDARTHRRVSSERQTLRRVNVHTVVVAAALSPSRRTLVLVQRVPGAPGDEHSGAYFRFHAVSVATWQAAAPPFDTADTSGGTAAPVFCVRSQVSCLGSEYVLASLGEHVLGVYSLTTAQLVAELALDLGAQVGREVRLLRAEAFALTRQHGVGTARGEGGDEAEVVAPGASLLAVALAAPRCCVTLLELDEAEAERHVVAQRAASQAAAAAAHAAEARAAEEAHRVRADAVVAAARQRRQLEDVAAAEAETAQVAVAAAKERSQQRKARRELLRAAQDVSAAGSGVGWQEGVPAVGPGPAAAGALPAPAQPLLTKEERRVRTQHKNAKLDVLAKAARAQQQRQGGDAAPAPSPSQKRGAWLLSVFTKR